MESNIKEFRHVEEFTKFIERFYKDKTVNKELITYKQSNQAAIDLKNYIEDYKKTATFIGDLDTRDFTYTKDELNYFLHERYNHLKFFDIIPVILPYSLPVAFKNFICKIPKQFRTGYNQSLVFFTKDQ